MTPFWTDGTATIWHADALALPLPDASVDLIVTSPPYFGLRSYQDGGVHYANQIGSEPTPAEFVDALIAATREMVRVLKPSGSLWINLGDKYAGGGGFAPDAPVNVARRAAGAHTDGSFRVSTSLATRTLSGGVTPTAAGVRAKSLIGIPWRYALRCIDDLGLILRAEVIWSKPNGLPESVTDRVRRSHEQWFHLVREPRYYSAVDEVREGHSDPVGNARYAGRYAGTGNPDRGDGGAQWVNANPLGKLPGSVWTIPEDPASLVRSVLSAVAAGALTPEEGERLWLTARDSWNEYGSLTDVGSGRATGTHADTPRSRSADARNSGSTGSPMNCTPDPSLTVSPSTTSAGTHRASTQTTSSPSPSARTSDEPTPNGLFADTDTHWPTPTSTGLQPGSPTRSAARASSDDAGESVWSVPTQPLRVPPELGIDHFAAFPMALPRRIIRGWSPRDVCSACGEGRRPVSTSEAITVRPNFDGMRGLLPKALIPGQSPQHDRMGNRTTTITGYACACTPYTDHAGTGERHANSGITGKSGGLNAADPARSNHFSDGERVGPWREYHWRDWTPPPTTPGVILDPFGGTGTTALVAVAEGRTAHHVDLSADYCRLAQWRITDPGERARAREVEKPPVQINGQAELFEGIA